MEDVHREILRRNHSMLVREMSPELVADQLYSDSIFTSEMRETVLVQMTTFAKARKVLEYLPRQGKKAFHLFCQALEKADQPHFAAQLRLGDSAFNQFHDSQASTSQPKQKQDKPPPKKYSQLCMFDLGDDVYVTANLCDNTVQIHIRQYDRGNSKPYPTKKGIVMTLTEWLLLETFLNSMEAAVKNYSEREIEETWYLGSDIYVSASKEYPLLDFRRNWKPDPNGDMVPTTKGVKLNRRKLEHLKSVASFIQDYIPQEFTEYPIPPPLMDLQSLEGLLDIPM
jgi:hypothetical protein